MSGCGLPDGVNGHTMGFAGYVDDAAARTTDDIEDKRDEEAKSTTSSSSALSSTAIARTSENFRYVFVGARRAQVQVYTLVKLRRKVSHILPRASHESCDAALRSSDSV